MRLIQGGARGMGALVIGGLLCMAGAASSLSGSELDARRAEASPADATLTSPPIVSDDCAYQNSWLAPRAAGRRHVGVDIIAPRGTPVVAVVDGTISRQRFDRPGSMSGNQLNVRSHVDATYYVYLHLDRFAADVGLGFPVTAGQVIGYVGATGATSLPHLHFEVHPLGGAAVDPTPYVDAAHTCTTSTFAQSTDTTRVFATQPLPAPPVNPPTPTANPATPASAPATQPPAATSTTAPLSALTPSLGGTPVLITGILQPNELLTAQVSGLPGLPPAGTAIDVSISLTSATMGSARAWACASSSAQYGVPLTVGPGTSTTRLTLSPSDGNVCISADVPASYFVAIN